MTLRRSALLVSLAVAVGCARAPQRKTIRVGLSRFLSNGPLAIALDDGDFRRHGLDVEFVMVDSVRTSTPMLARGEIDAESAVVIPGLFNLMARTRDIRIVAGKGDLAPGGCTTSAFVVTRKFAAAHDLSDPRSFAAARVGILPDSFVQYLFERELRRMGSPDAAFRAVKLDQPQAAAAISSGAVDVADLAEPFLSKTLAGGNVVVWRTLEEMAPGGQLGMLVFGRRLLRDDRDAGRRFLAGFLDGLRRYEEGKTPRNIDILTRFTGMPRALVASACWDSIRADGSIDTDSNLGFEQWLRARGDIDAVVPVSGFWDGDLLRAARQR